MLVGSSPTGTLLSRFATLLGKDNIRSITQVMPKSNAACASGDDTTLAMNIYTLCTTDSFMTAAKAELGGSQDPVPFSSARA